MSMSRRWLSLLAVLSCISTAAAPVVGADSPYARGTGEVKGLESRSCNFVAPMAGGPDGFGYSFLDQADPGGPAADFLDISVTGTAQTFTAANIAVAPAEDDGVEVPS